MYLVVRLSPLAKNVPQRNRAGFRFNHLAQVVEVTEAQEKEIRADAYLKVLNFPSVGWFEGMGIERTQKNEDKVRGDGEPNEAKNMPKKLSKNARLALRSDGTSVDDTRETSDDSGAATGQGEGDKTKVVPPAPLAGNKHQELTASSPREELVAALVRKHKVEGKDFAADAKPEALFALLKSL